MSRLTKWHSIPCGPRREITLYSISLIAGVLLLSGLIASVCASPLSRYAQATHAGIEVAQYEKDIRPLEPNKPIARELTAGQVHSYQIELVSGQYVRILVDQRGIDVVVVMIGPDGNKIVEVDSPNGRNGLEPVSVMAEAEGKYLLEVRSVQKEAVGHYEIRIEELRKALPQDTIRINAEKIFMEATRLLARETPESLQEAIKRCEAVLPLFHELGDRPLEALALHLLGRSHDEKNEKQKAIDYYSKSRLLFHELGDWRREGQAIINIAGAYNWLGDNDKTIDYYSQSLPFFQLSGHRPDEIDILIVIGESYFYIGEMQKALDFFNRARRLMEDLSLRLSEARVLHDIGAVYRSLGDSQKALDYLTQALRLRRARNDRKGEAYTLNAIGVVQYQLGLKLQALDSYNQALTQYRATHNIRGEAYTLTNIGKIYSDLKEKSQALDFLNQALRIRRDVDDRYGEALTLHSIGEVYEVSGESQQALDFLNQALRLRRATGDRHGEVASLYGMARVERRIGSLAEARADIEHALNIIESSRAKLISHELRTSYFASEQECYGFYINLLMQLHKQNPSQHYDAIALQVSEQARARSLLELLNEARADIRQGIDPELLARERSLRQFLNLRVERQAHLLSSKHTEAQGAAAKKQIEDAITQYQEIEAQIKTTSPRYAALTQPQPLTLSEIQQQALGQNTLLLEYALGDEHSYLWAVSQSAMVSYELPKRADVEAVARHVADLLTMRNRHTPGETIQQRWARLTQAEAQYPAAAAALSQMVLSPAASLLKTKRLLIVCEGALQYIPFAALPMPVAGGQASADSEPLSGDSGNRHPPASYLPLIVDHEVISLPSASALAVLRSEFARHKPAARAVAVLADPVFDKDDDRRTKGTQVAEAIPRSATVAISSPQTGDVTRAATDVGLAGDGRRLTRLPFSRREAEAILAVVPRGEGLMALDFKASRATATSAELAQYRIVHFATHGLLDSEHPELSGIVLSLVDEQGASQDGFLRLHDIYNLNLPVDMVVLSACQTALGKDIRGEGLVGLTRGFMYAGAARVVASLWQVDDVATAELMSRFYRGMMREKLRPAAALQAAQVEMWKQKRWQSPYYWAAFVLQGEWL